MSEQQAKLIAVARGSQPADVLLANAKVVNTITGNVESGNIAICGERIAGVGNYQEAGEVIDLAGKYAAPGLINGHTHLESSLLDIGQYARAVIPRGTLSIVTDLHEIANVCGVPGVNYIMDCARRLPFNLFLMAPSCVPATHLETSGAAISAGDIRHILCWRGAIGLGEVMNYPGVISGDPVILEKIEAAKGKPVDGHAPGVRGKDLNAYIAAGIHSDHESVSPAEAQEKLDKGLYIMIREGTSEKNLEALLPLVTDTTYRRCIFVVDDRSCADLLHDGDIDAVVRKAIRLGMDPVRAIQLATVTPAAHFRLEGMGAIAPGYYADLIVFPDLKDVRTEMAFYHGRMAAQGGEPLFQSYSCDRSSVTGTVHMKSFARDKLKMKARGETMPVIGVITGQIVTKKLEMKIRAENGYAAPDIERDILKIAVVERHKMTGNVGVGLVKGFGLKRGALASSVAHDSHNIVAVGTNDNDIIAAVKAVENMQGGLAVAAGGNVIAELSLPIAGLLSDKPLEQVVARHEKLEKAAREIGCTLPAPFATLSFLALPVIPELKLTDLGLVDVLQFKIIT